MRLIFAILMLFSFNGISQEREFDPIVVNLKQSHILYRGVDNPVIVHAPFNNQEEIFLTTESKGVEIVKHGDFSFSINPRNFLGKLKLKVKIGDKESIKICKVRRIPNPVPMLSGKQSGYISRGEFLSQPGLICVILNFDICAKCKIERYQIERVSPKTGYEVIDNKNSRYSSAALDIIKKAKVGDIYIFSQIIVRCSGDRQAYPTEDAIFRIK